MVNDSDGLKPQCVDVVDKLNKGVVRYVILSLRLFPSAFDSSQFTGSTLSRTQVILQSTHPSFNIRRLVKLVENA